jgi:hypothetical protein
MNRTSYAVIFAIATISLALVPIIAVLYSYTTLSLVESGAGFIILLAISVFLWANRGGTSAPRDFTLLQSTTSAGIVLGMLWLVEISINNFIAPPLPARDIIDNLFWASIALSILVIAILSAYRATSVVQGIKAGAWSGFVSGLLACCAGLSMIVFAMPFITRDPLNIAEWSLRQAGSGAPTMAAYFAYETFAGAFLHLLILGLCMGGLLGIFGGVIGKIAGLASFRFQAK